MFTYFIENNLISENQSGFKPGNSCVNQLITITHEIFSKFDDNYEVGGVFLDISKAFDKVWHEGIIHKLKRNEISGNLLSLLTDFRRNRKQRVILILNVYLGPISMLAFLKILYCIYLIIFNVIRSYSRTTRSCFLLLKCPKEPRIT